MLRARWRRNPNAKYRMDVHVEEPVGLVAGRITHTIRLVSDGVHIHAYPVTD